MNLLTIIIYFTFYEQVSFVLAGEISFMNHYHEWRGKNTTTTTTTSSLQILKEEDIDPLFVEKFKTQNLHQVYNDYNNNINNASEETKNNTITTRKGSVLNKLLSKTRKTEKYPSYSCGEVIATLSSDETKDYIREQYPLLYLPSFFLTFTPVQIRKICSSCNEIKELNVYDDEVFNKYCGSTIHGNDIVHSGLVVYPMETCREDSRIYTFQSGEMPGFIFSSSTFVNTSESPSELGLSSYYTLFGILGASLSNAISIIPDFMGYGESTGLIDRGYLIKDSYVTSTLPLWIKVKSDIFDESGGKSSLIDTVAFAGYSEGGYASTALSDGFYSLGIEVIKTFAAGAPFKMSSVLISSAIEKQDNGIDNSLYRFVYLMTGASFSSTYPGMANYNVDQDFIASQYIDPANPSENVLEWLREDDIDEFELNARLSDGWDYLVKPEFLEFFRDAIKTNTKEPCLTNYQVGFNDKLCDALLNNDLTEILETATYNIQLCHSPFDDLVDIENLPDFSRNPNLDYTFSFGDHLVAAAVCLNEIVNFLTFGDDVSQYVKKRRSSCTGICSVDNLMGKTFYIPAYSACWKLELFKGGVLAVDYSNLYCYNDEYSEEQVFSYFESAEGNIAHFGEGSLGWSGQFGFTKDSRIDATKVDVKLWEETYREFLIDMTFPDCD